MSASESSGHHPYRCDMLSAPYNDKHELQTKVARALLLQGA
jgi:hypothetical protein